MTNALQRIEPQAEQVRCAVVRAFEEAYEYAGVRGLCPEGRYEVALEAARKLDLDALCEGICLTSRGTSCGFVGAPTADAG